jgi:hypothetical protein
MPECAECAERAGLKSSADVLLLEELMDSIKATFAT